MIADSAVVIIGVITTSVLAIIAAVFSGLAALRTGQTRTTVDAVHDEVKTINGRSLAQLADATESRRIDQIDPADRTRSEAHHVAATAEVASRPIDIRDQPLGG